MFSRTARPLHRIARRPRYRMGLRDAVILTAPVVLLLGYLFVAAMVDYHRAMQFRDYWAAGISVEQRFLARASALFRLLPELRSKHRIDAERDDPGMVRLQLDPAVFDRAYRDPQLGWADWMEGNLVEAGGRLLPVRVHKRGDNSVHWLTEKKTLTVRTRKNDFFKRYRSFGLSGKDVLTSFVANRLAREFDLLAPTTTVVPVVVNNRYAGMFRFVEVVDESFLRPYDRMPGNIFRGDAAERGEYFKGLNRDLFANPYIWDRVAVSERPTAAGADQLRLFIEDLNGGDFAAHQRLMSRVDKDELARLVAFLLLLGDPYHMDGVHNQLWYEDPSTARLHPIPWDIRVLPLADSPRDELNGFLRAALRDPWLVDGIQAELRRRLADAGDAWLALTDSIARGAWTRYHEHFRYDSLRGALIPPIGHPDAVRRVLTDNVRVLRGWLANSAAVFAAANTGTAMVLDVETRGFAGIELTGLEVSPLAATAVPVLRMDRNRNGVLDAEDPLVPGAWSGAAPRRFIPATPLPLLAAWHAGQPGRDGAKALAPGTQHYRLFLVGVGGSATVRPLARNRNTHEPAELAPWPAASAIAASGSWSPWQYPVEYGRLHRFSGAVHLAADLRLSPSDTLVIEPGTTIRLDPDVSIVSRGRVIAAGTAARPITFTRADARRPWGALSLLGAGADSSRFSYVTFEWGGGALVDRIEYIGMVNVHRARGVVVEHSLFQDNLRSDDTFHALHAEVTLRASRFLRANSDAVDFDISSGLIADNTFEQSGGDAIDLMTSTPVVRGNLIRNSGDKGISIGEASHPFIYANRIEGSKRGIEVKDRSDPIVLSNILLKNGVGIYEDRKNWRYGGGGWATVINTALGANTDSLLLDPDSRITLAADSLAGADSLFGRPPELSVRFEEDFASLADGWKAAGGVTGLLKQEGALYTSVERRQGIIGKALDWDLRGRAGPATLVLALAARNLDAASVSLLSPEGDLRELLTLRDDPAVFQLVTMRLPPRRYTAIVLTLSPRPRIEKRVRDPGWTELKPGQFWLRGYDLYGVGATSANPPKKPAS